MPDIRERLDVFNHLEPPDLWAQAQRREPRPSVDDGSPRSKRIGIALLALAVAAAGIGLAVRAFNRSPSVVPISPTAKNGKIVFVRGASGHHAQLWITDPDGTSARPLLEPPGEAGFVAGSAGFPSWSPDGTQLVFAYALSGGRGSGLWLVRADGSGGRRLTSCEQPACMQDSEPAWSPDGTKIAFVRNEDIYVMNADGSGVQRLTSATTPLGVGQPSWSPDGRQIAFTVARVQPYNLPAIDVMNADGTDVRQLTDCLPACIDSQPAWSPDGTRIAFVRGATSSPFGHADVWVMSPDGSDPRSLTSCVDIAGCVEAGGPVWSPDGARIVFTVQGRDSVRQLFVMHADGSEVRPLLAKTRDVCCMAWQPASSGSPMPSQPYAARACRGSDLMLRLGGPISEATQQDSRLLTLTNASSSPCTLHGYPNVTLTDRSGIPIPFRYRDGGDQMVTSRPPRTLKLAPGDVAYVLINKVTCVAHGYALATTVEITVPGSPLPLTTPMGKYPIIAYCGPADPGSVIDISPFAPTARAVLAF